MSKHLIITGASKGLGNALALKYLNNGYTVYSLSRTEADNLQGVHQIKCDLSKLDDLQGIFTAVLTQIKDSSPTSITLINNAGSLGLINTIENIDYKNIIQTINVNYSASALLNSLFIKETESCDLKRAIRTISSGAANGAYHGWSVYCSTKAAIDRMTKVIGVEQKEKENPTHVLSIYPGVVDTGMQALIRDSSEEEFSQVERFKTLKEENQLAQPKEVAQWIYQIDLDSSLENGSIVDVRDYKG